MNNKNSSYASVSARPCLWFTNFPGVSAWGKISGLLVWMSESSTTDGNITIMFEARHSNEQVQLRTKNCFPDRERTRTGNET